MKVAGMSDWSFERMMDAENSSSLAWEGTGWYQQHYASNAMFWFDQV